MIRFWTLALCLSTATLSTVPVAAAADDRPFREQVAPILESRCVRCHGGDKPKGGLILATAEGLRRGGDSGEVVAPGRPGESLLIDYVAGDEPAMPQNDAPLSAVQVETLRQWISAGAPWPKGVVLEPKQSDAGWWSLQPLSRPHVPQFDSGWIRTPVDAFILDKLQRQSLSPSPEADRRTLIRRLTYDLHGLPPTPEEIENFVNDSRPRAYELLAERLLASPRYGERWARHWLDVVHYGDTHGYDKDKRRDHAWPYRDYVVRAFNEDKSYRRFVLEQLAGDVLFPGQADGIIATGFLAAGPWDFVGHVELREGTLDKKITRMLDRDDMVTTTMATFTSLTVHCARCHDHKFDPVTQNDYYSLQAVFAGIDRADRPYDVDPQVASQRRTLLATRTRLETEKTQLDTAGTNASSHDAGEQIARIDEQLRRITEQIEQLPPPSLVFAAASSFPAAGTFTATGGRSRPIHLLHRGSVETPGQFVGPGTVDCVAGLDADLQLDNPDDEGARRAALGRWIVDGRNSLAWRSIVNRVWHYRFGRGIVDTPNDLGRMGSRPTHAKLLDWLAVEFRDRLSSPKQLDRLIVTSAVYRQASSHQPEYARIDAANRFLWRKNRRRLEAEEIRDAVLTVSGRLNSGMYGPGFDLFGFKDDHSPHYMYDQHDPDEPGSNRRSIYRFIVRSVPDPFMETLDCADPSQLVAVRNRTITPLQALALLNNRFVVRQAAHFADRLRAHDDDPSGQIDRAFRLAVGRSPDESEKGLLAGYVQEHGIENACRLIFNSNEFIFVD